MPDLYSKVKDQFVRRYQRKPSVYFSPGRINLIGEHVDYNDGFVMPCAIDKGVYYAISLNDTRTVRIYSLDYNELLEVDLSKIEAQSSWKNYVLSVINELQKDGKELKGFDCVFGGNVPVGAGLSSSAAVEGGLAFGLNDLQQLGYDRKQLATLCQRAEHGFPQVNCGIMDQYANMLGKKNHAILLDCRSIEHTYLPLDLGEYHILLLNSKVHHSLADSAYNTRRNECDEGLSIIKENSKYQSFRDIKGLGDLDRFKDKIREPVWRRCSFVVGEIIRTQKAAKMLKKGKLEEFGKLMFQSHDGLSNLFKVSCAELDFLVDQAKIAPGVIGSRMMGGGFGGCTINIVHESTKDQFISNTLAAYKKEFQNEGEAYDVMIGDGTYRMEEE